MGYETGYFYYYPKPNSYGVSSYCVHVVDKETSEPLCGTKRHKDSKFNFCSAGIHRPYVTCSKCLKKIDQLETANADSNKS